MVTRWDRSGSDSELPVTHISVMKHHRNARDLKQSSWCWQGKSPLELCTRYFSPEPTLQQVRPQHISSTTDGQHCITDIRDDQDISWENSQCCNSIHMLREGFPVWFYRKKKPKQTNQILSNQHSHISKILENRFDLKN